MRRIAVIGAGAAGLCAAKHLQVKGLDPVIFEHGSHIGGLWVYGNDNGMSPAYLSLHCNSEARVTAYKDFPFPDSAPLYPDHRQMTEYFMAYAERFRLRPLIRFNTPVTAVSRESDGRWRVETAGGAETFDAVVVASGHQHTPRHPEWTSDFTGEYLHAHDYRVPEPFKGKHVLVIGVGNSACDIAADICTHAAATVMAARSPVLLMPRMFLGVPTARVLAKVEKPWMPWPIRRWCRTMVSRMAHGTMEQWGFRTPKTRTHPAGHHLLIGQFIWGRIAARPGIRSVQGRRFTFADGATGDFDTVIAATGYEVAIPFLPPDLSPMAGHRLDLFQRVVKPGVEGLYFVGFFNVSGGGNVRMMDDQAEWVAALEAGDLTLPAPEAMRRAIAADQARIARLYPDSPRYGLELDPADYRKALAAELKRARVAGPAGKAAGQRR